jgi:Na+(H+)/acetate symporter ActP
VTEPATIAAIAAVTVVTAVISARGVRIARTPADFMVAARQVPSFLNASAISGEYLSAASFLGIAGLAMLEGLGALWYAVGYAAGYLVLLVAVAAPLRRFGAYTIPDFAEGRLESPVLRRAATGIVLVICGFYLLPQLKGAGLTLQVAFGGPEWIGVIVLGVIVTLGIASGGMKGITFVQAFQYWLKITALAIPAIFLVMFLHHPPIGSIGSAAPHSFDQRTTIQFPASEQLTVGRNVHISAVGQVDGTARDGPLTLTRGTHEVHSGTTLIFPAGAQAPRVQNSPTLTEKEWTSPLLHLGGEPIHPLAATYGILLATVLGAMGLPHILVRFYTNRDGQAARRTTAFVLLLLGCFYIFPAIFAVLGRLEAPGLYVSGQTDSVVLVLPKLASTGVLGTILGALVAAGAFAAFLSTSSGLFISMAGALSHDIMGRGVRTFRASALMIGVVMTALGIFVVGISINVLVGWAFAIAASTFCPLLLLGIWWRRLTWIGALGGLILGGGASSAAVILTMVGVGATGWPAVLLGEPAIWTVPLAFLTMVALSLATPRALPHDVIQKLLALHLPERVRPPSPRRPELSPALPPIPPTRVPSPQVAQARQGGGPAHGFR